MRHQNQTFDPWATFTNDLQVTQQHFPTTHLMTLTCSTIFARRHNAQKKFAMSSQSLRVNHASVQMDTQGIVFPYRK